MGTGGANKWVVEVANIAEQINIGFAALDCEMGNGKNVPKLQQVAAGEFVLKMFGKEWCVSIREK